MEELQAVKRLKNDFQFTELAVPIGLFVVLEKSRLR